MRAARAHDSSRWRLADRRAARLIGEGCQVPARQTVLPRKLSGWRCYPAHIALAGCQLAPFSRRSPIWAFCVVTCRVDEPPRFKRHTVSVQRGKVMPNSGWF